MSQSRIRILIADDHPMFREGINLILSGDEELAVVANAGTAAEAFRLAREYSPDIILLDISLPDVDGLSALPQISEAADGARIVVLSMHIGANHILRAFEMGAAAYIAKQSASRDLVEGLRAVNRGERFLDEITKTELSRTPGFSHADIEQLEGPVEQ
ncbi:MAG: response regulator [Spirochaetota bacterium]